MAPTHLLPLDAAQLLKSFRLRPGFRIELVASEPLLTAPVALAFDENGRAFVAEMPGFMDPVRPGALPPVGRIRVLTGLNASGSFTNSSIYANDLPWPSAVVCFQGGVFVATAPDVLYFKDSRRDGVADLRRTVFTGLGGTNQLSTRMLPNNFKWGMDNRIHGGSGGANGEAVIGPTPTRSGPVSLGGQDFAFDPFTTTITAEAGVAQSGLTLDSSGRKFTTSYLRPLQRPMIEPRYVDRNLFVPRPPLQIDVALPPVLAFSAVAPNSTEPAGNGQTVNGLFPTWLTNACGGVIFLGNALGTNLLGNFFVADPQAHLVHRMVLRDNGLNTVALPPPNERTNEFLVCSDPLFQPVQLLGGPDGALYIVDYHGGGENGRIYRIVLSDHKAAEPPLLSQATTSNLVVMLAHPDGWCRETAGRLLCERHDAAALPGLTNMLQNSRLPLARLHAFHVLSSLGWLTEPHVLRALSDPDERLREQGVKACDRFLTGGKLSERLWTQLKKLPDDPSARVRLQLACLLGDFRHVERPAVQARLLAREPENLWIRAVVMNSLGEGAVEILTALAVEPKFTQDRAGRDFLLQFAVMIATRGRLDEVGSCLDFLTRANLESMDRYLILRGLGEGLMRTRSSLGLLDPQERLKPFFDEALALCTRVNVPDPVRVEAIRLLGVSPYDFDGIGDMLLLLLGTGRLGGVESAAISTLGRFNDKNTEKKLVPGLLLRWPMLAPAQRSEAIAAMLSRTERIPAVIQALEARKINLVEVPQIWVDFLRGYPDPEIRSQVMRLFGPGLIERPEEVKQFSRVLRLKGVSSRGHNIFLSRCASCHRVGTEGNPLGPDPSLAAIADKERVIRALVQPNAERTPGFTTTALQTRGGRVLIGLLAEENAETVTLKQPGNVSLVWPRNNIQFLTRQSWSLMPERFERSMSQQDVADLIEFLAPDLTRKLEPNLR
jgi:putative membrane-bound dehydrogenase-like protein